MSECTFSGLGFSATDGKLGDLKVIHFGAVAVDAMVQP